MSEALGLFPSFADHGGIQVSGKLAASTLRRHFDGSIVTFGGASTDLSDLHLNGKRDVVKLLAWRRKPDLILVWHVALLKLVPLLRVRNARIVCFLHGIEAWHRFGVGGQLLCRRVDRFFSNSSFTWKRFVDQNGRFADSKTKVVPLGIGRSINGTQILQGRGAVTVGRIDRQESYKGHAQLIDVWPRVEQRVPGATLTIVGEGDGLPELKNRARPTSGIRFTGAVDDEEKERILSGARAFLMPSKAEGFGLVYVEAMRLGRPCLVGNGDAGSEVVEPGRCGLAVDPDNSEALADAIVRLLTPGDEWIRWSHAAKDRYDAFYTEERFTGRLVAALQEVITN